MPHLSILGVNRRRTLTSFWRFPASNTDQANLLNRSPVSIGCSDSSWSTLDAGPWSIRLAGSHSWPMSAGDSRRPQNPGASRRCSVNCTPCANERSRRKRVRRHTKPTGRKRSISCDSKSSRSNRSPSKHSQRASPVVYCGTSFRLHNLGRGRLSSSWSSSRRKQGRGPHVPPAVTNRNRLTR